MPTHSRTVLAMRPARAARVLPTSVATTMSGSSLTNRIRSQKRSATPQQLAVSIEATICSTSAGLLHESGAAGVAEGSAEEPKPIGRLKEAATRVRCWPATQPLVMPSEASPVTPVTPVTPPSEARRRRESGVAAATLETLTAT